jgi:hypothetical protein
METEDAFLSDVNVDNIYRRLPASKRTGKKGDTEAEPSRSERSPLLQGSSEDGWDEGSRNGEGDTPDEEFWVDEYSQWDGLPWYRRPSVSDDANS